MKGRLQCCTAVSQTAGPTKQRPYRAVAASCCSESAWACAAYILRSSSSPSAIASLMARSSLSGSCTVTHLGNSGMHQKPAVVLLMS